MRCISCNHPDTLVKDTRENKNALRRRRYCPHCKKAFTTVEIAVDKSNDQYVTEIETGVKSAKLQLAKLDLELETVLQKIRAKGVGYGRGKKT